MWVPTPPVPVSTSPFWSVTSPDSAVSVTVSAHAVVAVVSSITRSVIIARLVVVAAIVAICLVVVAK